MDSGNLVDIDSVESMEDQLHADKSENNRETLPDINEALHEATN
jgi:hypothetical protein